MMREPVDKRKAMIALLRSMQNPDRGPMLNARLEEAVQNLRKTSEDPAASDKCRRQPLRRRVELRAGGFARKRPS